MKRGKLIACLAAAAAVIFCATLLALAAQRPPETITIKPSIWKTLTKPLVKFSHKKHVTEYRIACNRCHMIYKDGKNVWKEGDPVERCEKCHREPTTLQEYKPGLQKEKLGLKPAFHKLCLTCHRKIKNRHPRVNAPIVCAGCHKPRPAK